MGDIVPLSRAPAAAEPRCFDDPRWADRHRPNDAATSAVDPAPAVEPDCICTAGTVCRHNNACPRLVARRASSVVELRP